MRRYNLRVLFNACGVVVSMTAGDFGATGGDHGKRVESASATDCLVSWPVLPACTGAQGIAAVCGWPIGPEVTLQEQ